MQQCGLTPAPSGFMRGQTAGWGEGEGNRGGGGGVSGETVQAGQTGGWLKQWLPPEELCR